MRNLMIILFAFSISANTDADTVWMTGGGTLYCGEWVAALNERNSPQQQIFIQWVAGYTGSYNWYRGESRYKSKQTEIRQPSLNTISLWLTTYCNNNPTHKISQASAALIQQLGGEATSFKWGK